MDSVKWTDAVSAVTASVSALAVILAMLQLRTTKAINQLEFEDGLDKEYRDLVARIPTKSLLGSGLSPSEYKDAFGEYNLEALPIFKRAWKAGIGPCSRTR